MLIYKRGDILTADEKFIIHGCNCFHVMGGGLAKQIKKKYPGAYEVDLQTVQGDKKKLGTYSVHLDANYSTWIFNLYTQYNYGGNGRQTQYDAVYNGLRKICMDFDHMKTFALPHIGCGLGGGDWEIVKCLVEAVSLEFSVTFNVYYL